MKIFAAAALGLALIAGSMQAKTITFTGLSLSSATLAGTSPNKLTWVVNVGGMTDGVNTATLTGAKLTFVTGLVDNANAVVVNNGALGLVVYPFVTTGASRILLGGASTPVIPAGTTLMSGISDGGASLTFTRTGNSGVAGTWSYAAPTQIVSIDATLAAFMGLAPTQHLMSFASQFSFNGNISAYALNSTIPLTPRANFLGNFSLTEVPEPASMALMGAGLAGLALLRRRMNS